MDAKELEKKIAKFEFINDQLESELAYIDKLLKSIGFPHGLQSAKEVAEQMLQEEL